MKKRIVLSACAAFALLFMAVDGPVACGIGTSPSEAATMLVVSGGADDEQDGIGTSPSFADVEKDPGGYAASMLDAAKSGKWRLFAAGLLIALVWAARRWGASVVPWLKTDRGGATLVLVLALLGGVATTLADGADLSFALVVNSLSMAFTAAGGFAVVKKLLAPADVE